MAKVMNKALNKYKKSCWIKIRISKPHRVRIVIRKAQVALVIAQGIASISQIRMTIPLDKAAKAAAIAAAAIDAFGSASKLLKGKGE